MALLVVNAGSSSLKLRLLGEDDSLLWAADELAEPPIAPDLIGHRVVHGGDRFRTAVRIDKGVLDELHRLTDLAPLHQPKSLQAIEAISEAIPDVPAYASFDTAFHATISAAAATYALPRRWRDLRRYGFHGLSHSWVARQAGPGRVVSCHLGAGGSLCAIRDGVSVDTTMGFTPLEGLVMATRSGSVDPGLLMWLLEHEGLTPHALASTLEHESGLLGLAGTADMREVRERAAAGDAEAALALDVYLHRLRAGIAAMAASLGGIDTLVFTGGVGENAPEVRERACAGLEFLAVDRVLVVESREDLEIARQVRAARAAGA